MNRPKQYPFTEIVGQERMKEALILNLINPAIGGVLIRGQKGTAKTTAVRALADVVPALRVVELPMNATEDRVAGTIDVSYMLKTGEQKFEPGLLKEADGQILYVDEINLLEDHIVNLLLDAAASGFNTVEREGISVSHAARFMLVGTMNPEEGQLRPQLLDRFGLVVDVEGEKDPGKRMQILEKRLAFEADPAGFCKMHAPRKKELLARIRAAKKRIRQIRVDQSVLQQAVSVCIAMETQGHRADLAMIQTAKALAAFRGNQSVDMEDLRRAAVYVLPHRMRRNPFEHANIDTQKLDSLFGQETSPESGRKHPQKRSRKDDTKFDKGEGGADDQAG